MAEQGSVRVEKTYDADLHYSFHLDEEGNVEKLHITEGLRLMKNKGGKGVKPPFKGMQIETTCYPGDHRGIYKIVSK